MGRGGKVAVEGFECQAEHGLECQAECGLGEPWLDFRRGTKDHCLLRSFRKPVWRTVKGARE